VFLQELPPHLEPIYRHWSARRGRRSRGFASALAGGSVTVTEELNDRDLDCCCVESRPSTHLNQEGGP
jgi:hypothetical protein